MWNRKAIKIPLFILLFIIIFGIVSLGDEKTTKQKDATQLAMEGKNLSEEAAKKLEEQLKANPNDLSARTKLLGYYLLKAFFSPTAKQSRQKHIIWILQNHPEAEIAGLPFTWLNPVLDGEAYNAAKELWLKQVETHKNDTKILGNAARFFLINEGNIAEDLLKKAQTIEPDNPEWSKLLGHLYKLQMKRKSDELKKELAVKSLKQLEEALSRTSEEIDRFYLLDELAKAAFAAGDIKKAEAYAGELLNKASQHKNDWNYGNAIHQGNLILGRIALKFGNLEKAKLYLIEAGKTPGSPQLNSFGPNMALAKELLEKGERKIVIKYFQLCANFWEMGQDKLKSWTDIVKKGNIPDFGANLDY